MAQGLTLVPMSFKRWIQNKVGIGENREKLALIEKRIAALATIQQWGLPEILPIPEALVHRAWALVFEENKGLGASSPRGIHRSDPMFRYPFQVHGGDAKQVLQEYYQTGWDAATVLKKTCPSPEKVLDFGGGYGRVGRFLASIYPQAKRMISDPKSSAVDYQIKHFGALQDDEQAMDLIFAGSVFTHLPRSAFTSTLHALLGRLSRHGVLVLTLHEFISAEYVFHPYTEESALRELEDVLSKEVYGSVYCSESFWREALHTAGGLWKYTILNERFGGTQLYVVVSAG